tara:strand:- start:34 stop:699 length:666 start_codon:yes stop_codon:yes gene_type:complete
MFNVVYQTYCTDIEKSINEVINYYQEQNKNFSWWFSPLSTPKNMHLSLPPYGFIPEEIEYGMYLEEVSVSQELPTSLDVKQPSHIEMYQDFISIICSYDTEALAYYNALDFSKVFATPAYRIFVGYNMNGEAVASASLYKTNKMIGIYDLITKKGHQRKGYGTTMMYKLIQYAMEELETRLIFLTASSYDGLNIYKKLGFKTFCTFECLEFFSTAKQSNKC